MQTISDHHSEIWSIDTDPEKRYLVSGSADLELRFYTIKHDLEACHETETANCGDDKWQVLKLFGEYQRKMQEQVRKFAGISRGRKGNTYIQRTG
ncbi:putative transcription factor WD40-like family [Rosa chinensis]|uniref:Putative transcription factor WD40-like family n=1 Tax=Rosa chinensis TaxID=74649 RepID=A0A2P6P5D5_ROSCH|nr:putative transcription factor WD40-like family [Rosa chinensis]